MLNLLRLQDAWTAYDRRTETKKRERERERERQNIIEVIAQTWRKKLLHKFFFFDTIVIFTDELFQVDPYF